MSASRKLRLARGALRLAGLAAALFLLGVALAMLEPLMGRGSWSLRWPWQGEGYVPGAQLACHDACVGTVGIEWVLGILFVASAGILGTAGCLLRRRDLLHAAALGSLLGASPLLLVEIATAAALPEAREGLAARLVVLPLVGALPALGLWLSARTFGPGSDRRSLPRRLRDRLARVDLKRAWNDLPEE